MTDTGVQSSSVKVGIRVRPALAKEQTTGALQLNSAGEGNSGELQFKGQAFTFDYVFPPELSQYELYQHTAAPMLKSFMEGYNVTILAYGQVTVF